MDTFKFPLPPPPPPRAAAQPESASSANPYHVGRGGRASFRGGSRGHHQRGSHRGRSQSSSQSRGGNQSRGSYVHGSAKHSTNENSHNHSSLGYDVPSLTYHQETESSSAPKWGLPGQQILAGRDLTALPLAANTAADRGGASNHSIGGKRKREDDSMHSQFNNSIGEVKSKPFNKPKVGVAPAIPSFGAPLPGQFSSMNPSESNFSTSARDRIKSKPKMNQLGLTPRSDVHEESEDDGDEETMLASNSGPLRVEYNGTIIELSSKEALTAWLAERKKRWPTAARIEEQKQQALKERQAELRRRLELDQERKKAREQQTTATTQAKKNTPSQNKQEKTHSALERHLAKAEKLRKKLARAEEAVAASAMKSKSLGNERDDETAQSRSEVQLDITQSSTQLGESLRTSSEATAVSLGDSHQVDSSIKAENTNKDEVVTGTVQEDSEEDSSLTSSSDADTSSTTDSESGSELSAQPSEETSSRSKGFPQNTPSRVDAPRRVCRHFAAKRRCPMGKDCRFRHELTDSDTRRQGNRSQQALSAKRKSLFQRLVEQEQEAENRLALEAIKFLGEHGAFAK